MASTEREQIDEEVAGKRICDLLNQNASRHPDQLALTRKDPSGSWVTFTWKDYRTRSAEVAMGLASIGVGKGDFVGIQARNIPEHLIADMGIVHSGAIPVSLYNTLAPDQISYIANNCAAKVAIVENRAFLERWEKARVEIPSLEKVILMEDADAYADRDWVMSWVDLVSNGREALASGGAEAFETLWEHLTPDDIVTLIYTSGTTGPPKGVILTHYNAVWTAASLRRWDRLDEGGTYLSYLPLAHSAERMATHYSALAHVQHTYFCPEVLQVFEYVPEVRPISLVGVPRVWEKVAAAVGAGLAAEPNERKRKLAEGAIAAGIGASKIRAAGEPVPLGLRLKTALFDKLVYSKIREKIGLDKCVIPITGAAPIAPATLHFFDGIGMPLHELYGLSETSAPATANPVGAPKLGTIGKPLPGTEVKLLEDGELLLRGGNISPGYYKEPEKTAEAFDAEGWLHTGDIATIDEEGFISIVDRKKELIVTPGGKNISPSAIEGLLKQHPLIGQACVIGDKRRYISALIVLDPEVATGWATKNGIGATDIETLASHERVQAEIGTAVDAANEHLSQVEKVKRFRILPAEWTPDSEELTPTMKLKRRVINAKYADEIEALYADG